MAIPGAASVRRGVRDRRHEGFAGVAGDLLTSGEGVLVVVADVDRRRASLEGLIAGLAPDGLAVASWDAIGADPTIAEPHEHLLALDPPPVAQGTELLAGQGGGFVHLAWGPAECDFTRAHWRSQLDLRPPMAELWRALRDSEGHSLTAMLSPPRCAATAHIPGRARWAGVCCASWRRWVSPRTTAPRAAAS